jgi:hypothetical protein
MITARPRRRRTTAHGRGVQWQRRRWCVPDAVWVGLPSALLVLPVVIPPLVTGHQLTGWTRSQMSLASMIALAGSVVIASSSLWKLKDPVRGWLCLTLWAVAVYVFDVFSSLTAPAWLFPWIMAASWVAVPLIPVFWLETMVAVLGEWKLRSAKDRRWSTWVINYWTWIAARRVPLRWCGQGRGLATWRLVVYPMALVLIGLGEIPGLMVSSSMTDDGPWLGYGFHAHAPYVLVAFFAELIFGAIVAGSWAGWRLRAPGGVGSRFLVRWTAPLATVFMVLGVLLFLASGAQMWPEAIIDLLVLPPLLAYSMFLLAHGKAEASRRALYVLRRTWAYWLATITVAVAFCETTGASRFDQGVGVVIIAAVGGALAPRIVGPPPHASRRGRQRAGEESAAIDLSPVVGVAAAIVSVSLADPEKVLDVLAAPKGVAIDDQAVCRALASIGRHLAELEFTGRDLHALLKPRDQPGGQNQAVGRIQLERLLVLLAEFGGWDGPESDRELGRVTFGTFLTIFRTERPWRTATGQPTESELGMWVLSERFGRLTADGSDDRAFEDRLVLQGRAWQPGRRHPSGTRWWDMLADPQRSVEELRRWAEWFNQVHYTEKGRRLRRPGGTRFSDPGRANRHHYDRWLAGGFDRVVEHWRTRCAEAQAILDADFNDSPSSPHGSPDDPETVL